MARAIVLLGSNIHPEKNIAKAVMLLERLFDVRAVSSAWETQAVGSDGPNFINAAIEMITTAEPVELKLGCLRQIEQRFGRVRTRDKNSPRTIDLDVVVYENEILEPALWLQAHLALPISEILPDLPHPELHQTLQQVAETLRGSAIHRPDIIQFHTRP